MSVRYEDLIINTYDLLKNISDFLQLELSEEQLQYGIHGAPKSKMQVKQDPATLTIVRDGKRNPIDWFSENDKQFFIDTCKDHLKYDFGYNFRDMI